MENYILKLIEMIPDIQNYLEYDEWLKIYHDFNLSRELMNRIDEAVGWEDSSIKFTEEEMNLIKLLYDAWLDAINEKKKGLILNG